MDLIPAIDLLGGKCVRLTQGQYGASKEYSGDPVERAREFKAAGARRLHIVDLDGARGDSSPHLDLARKIKAAVGIPVQFGGGVRSLDAVRRILGGPDGLDAVILGTAAFKSPDVLLGSVAEFGDRVLVAVDARAGHVAIHGWQELHELEVEPAITMLAKAKVRGIVFTDTLRDGTLAGTNLAQVRPVVEMCRELEIPLYVAGGVRDVDDVRRLRDLHEPILRGVIAGKALYEETLDLAAGLAAARGLAVK